jgi:hypothetical protein
MPLSLGPNVPMGVFSGIGLLSKLWLWTSWHQEQAAWRQVQDAC